MLSQLSGVDFVAYGRDGRIVLLAEAKARRGTSKDWAARLRRNMLSHGLLPSAKFFLIATPERMYVWKHEPPDQTETAPEFTIDASKLFQPYFQRLNQDPAKIAPEAFELLVLTWLTDIAGFGRGDLIHDPSLEGLAELAGSLREARIENTVQ